MDFIWRVEHHVIELEPGSILGFGGRFELSSVAPVRDQADVLNAKLRSQDVKQHNGQQLARHLPMYEKKSFQEQEGKHYILYKSCSNTILTSYTAQHI